MQHKTQPRPKPVTSERTAHADRLFAPPAPTKSNHALASPASKLGSLLVLLAISSVAALGVFMPQEDDPIVSDRNVGDRPQELPLAHTYQRVTPNEITMPRNASQQAYALAYELARQRVQTVAGLTQKQRREAAREALAQVLSGNDSHFDEAATTRMARQAPDAMKKAAFRGVRNGETKGISAQSQALIERLLSQESRAQTVQ